METPPPTDEVSELQLVIERQRQLLDTLEGRLTDGGTSQTVETVRRALNARPERLARSQVRRAARGASAAPVVRITIPRGNDPLSQETRDIAQARLYTWQRADEVMAAITHGDYATARQALEDLLVTEGAIQILLEDLSVPQPSWRELQNELGRSSDLIVAALRQQMELIERPGPMAAVRTGQSQWIRAWHPYLMVIGQNRQG